jgi:hypothetical protein
MPEAKRITGRTPYASNGDFCRIFSEETDSLYRLSFLLTADCNKAEQCFVSGLEDSLKGSRVFKEWARSWARRAIIRDAARIINPRPTEENTASSFNSSGRTLVAEQVEIAAVLDLAPFERFVFVISVLEHYSEHECSVLLGSGHHVAGGMELNPVRDCHCQFFAWDARLGAGRISRFDQHFRFTGNG